MNKRLTEEEFGKIFNALGVNPSSDRSVVIRAAMLEGSDKFYEVACREVWHAVEVVFQSSHWTLRDKYQRVLGDVWVGLKGYNCIVRFKTIDAKPSHRCLALARTLGLIND